MSNNCEEIFNIKVEKLLSILFIFIGIVNIVGDDILIKSIQTNDNLLGNKANQIFLYGLIAAFLLYIVIVARNYNFYRQKKEAGLDASEEYKRFIGSILILIGFILIFDYFLQTGFRTNNPPVL